MRTAVHFLHNEHFACLGNPRGLHPCLGPIDEAPFYALSFVAGLYGMNFDTDSPWNMPELGLPFGYPLLVLVMALIAVGMLVFFRRKGWILSRAGEDEDEDGEA